VLQLIRCTEKEFATLKKTRISHKDVNICFSLSSHKNLYIEVLSLLIENSSSFITREKRTSTYSNWYPSIRTFGAVAK